MLAGSLDGLKKVRDDEKTLKERMALNAKDLVGGPVLSDEDAERSVTRLEEGEPKVAVLLVTAVDLSTGSMTLHDGTQVDVVKGVWGAAKKKLVASLMSNLVNVPKSKAPVTSYADVIFLKDYLYIGHAGPSGPPADEEVRLRIGVINGSGGVYTAHGSPLPGTTYNSNAGYYYPKKR